MCVSFTTQSTLVIVSVSFRALSSEFLAINLLMVCPLTNLQTSVSGGVYALHTRHGYGSVAVSMHLWCTHRTQICLSEIQLCSHKTCGAVMHVNIDWFLQPSCQVDYFVCYADCVGARPISRPNAPR